MKRLQTLTQLAEFIPKLLALHKTLDGLWEPEYSAEDFLRELVNRHVDHEYYGELDENGSIVYFIAINIDELKSFFWLFYVNKEYRQVSRTLLDRLGASLKERNVESVRFSTSNTSLSYERWVKKFGATKKYITYELEL